MPAGAKETNKGRRLSGSVITTQTPPMRPERAATAIEGRKRVTGLSAPEDVPVGLYGPFGWPGAIGRLRPRMSEAPGQPDSAQVVGYPGPAGIGSGRRIPWTRRHRLWSA